MLQITLNQEQQQESELKKELARKIIIGNFIYEFLQELESSTIRSAIMNLLK